MSEGQRQFFEYIVECLKEDKKEEGIALLHEGFQKQADGSFDRTYLDGYHTKMLELLKPEKVDEVKKIFDGFGNEHISKDGSES